MVMREMKRCLAMYDSFQGDVKGIREVCQLMERCDVHGEM